MPARRTGAGFLLGTLGLTAGACGEGQVCLCGYPVGSCVSASCSIDADCGDSFACTPHVRSPGCPSISFACQTASDTCARKADLAARQAFWGELERHAPSVPGVSESVPEAPAPLASASEPLAPSGQAASADIDRALSSCGLVPPALRPALRARVARDVIGPCAEALFASLDAGAQPGRAMPLSSGQRPLC